MNQVTKHAPDCAHVLVLQGTTSIVSDAQGTVNAKTLLENLTVKFGGKGGGSDKACRAKLGTVPSDAKAVADALTW